MEGLMPSENGWNFNIDNEIKSGGNLRNLWKHIIHLCATTVLNMIFIFRRRRWINNCQRGNAAFVKDDYLRYLSLLHTSHHCIKSDLQWEWKKLHTCNCMMFSSSQPDGLVCHLPLSVLQLAFSVLSMSHDLPRLRAHLFSLSLTGPAAVWPFNLTHSPVSHFGQISSADADSIPPVFCKFILVATWMLNLLGYMNSEPLQLVRISQLVIHILDSWLIKASRLKELLETNC